MQISSMYVHIYVVELVTCPQKAYLNTIRLRVATSTHLIFSFDLSIVDGSISRNHNMISNQVYFFVIIKKITPWHLSALNQLQK